MLLYLIKFSRPDIAYATRELTMVMDGAEEKHYRDMLQLIMFVVDTKDKGLILNP